MDSTSRVLDPRIVGEEHYRVARRVQEILQRYKELQDIIAILGMDELLKKINLQFIERGKFKDFYHSLSSWLKLLPDTQANMCL